jgi:hypothetical protein
MREIYEELLITYVLCSTKLTALHYVLSLCLGLAPYDVFALCCQCLGGTCHLHL